MTVDQVNNKAAMIFWNHQYDTVVFRTSLENLPALAAGKQYQVNKMVIDDTNANYYADFKNGFNGIGIGPSENAKVVGSSFHSGTTVSLADTLTAHSIVLLLIEPAKY